MFSQYDGLKVLLSAIFGDISCGGVAGSHYGQTKLSQEKEQELINWDDEDNEAKKIRKMGEQGDALRDIFVG